MSEQNTIRRLGKMNHTINELEARLGPGLASPGYSTSLCHSVLHARPVFDRRGWFQALQDRLKSTPYPDRL